MTQEPVRILETPRLRLRRLLPGDVDDLYKLYREPEIRRYSDELLGRCPPEAFTLGGDSDPSSCTDPRSRTASYLALFLGHIVAVTSIVVSATLLAPAKRASTALYAALITAWLVMGSAVLFSELDAFDLPNYALLAQQLVIVLWAALCVYAVHKRYGADFALTDDETATVAVLAVFLAVPYLMVFFLSS